MRGLFFISICCILFSCVKMEPASSQTENTARLHFAMDDESYKKSVLITENLLDLNYSEDQETRSGQYIKIKEITDTSSYLISIVNSSGTVIYSGKYGDLKEDLAVKAGTYKVSFQSRAFSEPEFSYPLFGDNQTIKAIADSTVRINLISRQITGGISLKFTKNFVKYFKGTGLYVTKDTLSELYLHGYSGSYLYFYPGTISVIYKNKDGYDGYTPPHKPTWSDTLLLTKKLSAGEMLEITMDYDVSAISKSGMSVSIDTARVWNVSYYNSAFFAPFGSVSVVYAKKNIGDTVDLYGFIVGGDATSSSFKKKAPFNSRTHIVLAKESWQSLRENTMAVELPNGEIRKALNLVDNPSMLGGKIVVRGTIVDSYFGHAGLKSVQSYKLY